MAHQIDPSSRRASRSNRRSSRRARNLLARSFGFATERLEPRVVPAIVFDPSFGQPTAFHDGGNALGRDTPVYLIFWGSYFTQDVTNSNGTPSYGKDAYNADLAAAKEILNSSFYSGLSEYKNSPGNLYLAGTTIDSTNANVAVTGASVESEVEAVWGSTQVGGINAPTSTDWPIYVVVTPPNEQVKGANGWNDGSSDSNGNRYHSDDWISTEEPGTVGAQAAVDSFSLTISHEIAEADSDPFENSKTVAGSSGVQVAAGQNFYTDTGDTVDNSHQISDYEGQYHNYRLYGPGSPLVQSYWSNSLGKFIIPDNNWFQFEVSGGALKQNAESSGCTLTLNESQFGSGIDDTISVQETSTGEVIATVDGNTAQFDPGVISHVVINTSTNADDSINITGPGSGGQASYPTLYTINAGAGSTEAVYVGYGYEDAGQINGSVTINSANSSTSLYVNDQWDTLPQGWSVSSKGIGLNSRPFVTVQGPVVQTDLVTGPSAVVDVESLPSQTLVDIGSGAGFVTLAQNGGNLDAIQGGPLTIDCTGPACQLSLNNAKSTSTNTVAIDNGTVTASNMAPVTYSNFGQVSYSAGSGTESISLGASSGSLDDVPATVQIFGGLGNDSLLLDDANHAVVTTPNGALSSSASYTLKDQFITRTTQFNYAGSTSFTTSESIYFQQIRGEVTLDADDYGTPINVEGTSSPTTVKLGNANTAVAVDSQAQSIQGITEPLMIQGGWGSNILLLDDRLDTGYANPTQTASYVFGGSSSFSRTDIYANPASHSSPPSTLTAVVTINYTNFASVTFDADNLGSTIDVEGIADPATINLGSTNTAVTVSKTGHSLAGMTVHWNFSDPLTLNGGTGVNTLVVNDQQDTYQTIAGYTVSSTSITRFNYLGINSDATPSVATINYQGFSGGVMLNTDNNGTSVDVEGTSVPTTVNVGSGNTAVSVLPVAQNLGQLNADLTVNGGSGVDSLSVNDSLNPLAAAIVRVGLQIRSFSYEYNVTGSDIARTQYTRTMGLTQSSTRNINYSAFLGGVTLDTDNNETGVDVEATSTPTTIDVGSGNTAVAVTPIDQSLTNLGADLTVNGGTGTDSLSVNDTLNPLVPSSYRVGLRIYTTSYYDTVTGQDISRTQVNYGLLKSWTTRNVNFANIKGGVTFDTDDKGTPVYAGATAPIEAYVNGGTGNNTLIGPAAANSWNLTSVNGGLLDSWLNFSGFANLDGGGVSDSFDFNPGGSLTGNINGEGGNDLLNYYLISTAVTVNLATGMATDVGGTISGIQGVVGGWGNNTLTGSGRSLLIGGNGTSTLIGGSSDSLMIAGITIWDLEDDALEAILDEWDRTDHSFTQRMNDLTNGGGLNDSYTLTLKTVSSNDKANTIVSNAGEAWIFARTSDAITGLKGDDWVTTLPTS